MNGITYQKDLVLLVADRNMEYAAKGILSRAKALKIREVTFDIYVSPWNDSGCLLHGCDILRSLVTQYKYALVMLDHKGCGQEQESRTSLEEYIEKELTKCGWSERAAAVVIDPELENWVWSDSPHVDSVLGWSGKQPDLRNWLIAQGLLSDGKSKPVRPKKAMEEALRTAQKARSSALFLQLAKKVSIERCADPAFAKLKTVLITWFPRT